MIIITFVIIIIMLIKWVAWITVIIFAILFIVLWVFNSKKLYTYNDMSPPKPEVLKNPIINPVVYQLVYVSSSLHTWTLLYNKVFLDDWNNNRINYLIINGTLYNIERVDKPTSPPNMVLTLQSSCDTISSFGGCTDIIPNWTTNTVLYVLGYKL